MKKWETPEVSNLSLDKTANEMGNQGIEYVDYCNFNVNIDVALTGVGKEDYTDPNKKPSQHPTWVWCHIHNRWHPKDHGNNGLS